MDTVKMIVMDLDGTLLRSDGTISGYTVSVLRRCRRHGIKIVFATNRTFRRVKPYLDLTPCDAVICHKGAAIYDGHNKYDGQNKLTDLCIPAQTAAEVLRGLNDGYPHMPIIADCDETLYANFDVSEAFKNAGAVITDFTDLPHKPVEIIYAGIDCDETMEKVRAFLPDGMDVQKLHEKFIFIMNREATKLNALKILTQKHGIAMREAVCFGDYLNDIEMIRAAGKGVAVANALDEVKAAADETAASNDEDGVAHYIDNLLF